MVKKVLLILVLLAAPAFAQHTVVSAQVLDPGGSIYVNCTGSAVFVGQNTQPGQPPYNLGGSTFQQQLPINCDSFGRFSTTLADNLFVRPTPSQWRFNICAPVNLSPNGQPPPICFNTLITITGATQDVTAALQAAAATLPAIGGGGGNLSAQGTLTAGHDVQVFDQTHLQDLNITGTGLGVRQTGANLLGTTTVANLTLSGILGLTQCLHVSILGVVTGTGQDCGAGGGGGVGGTNKQFQFNNAGVIGGTGAQNGATQSIFDVTTGKVSFPNIDNTRTVNATYNFSQSPAADLSSAGAKTITLTPCPLGIDTSNNALAQYFVYIATTGTPEAVAVTGGSCTSGAASGTITVTTVNAHAAGYTVGSATAGIQEAINDAGTNNAYVIVPPTLGSSPSYNVYSTIYLTSHKMTLSMYGAWLSCQTRGPCIFISDRGNTYNYHSLLGGRLSPGLNIDGIQITNTTSSSGVYTVTTNGSHPFVTGDYVWVQWYQSNASQKAVVLITGTTSNTFTYSLGTATVTSAASFGWAALETVGVEDNSENASMRDLKLANTGTSNRFSFGVVIDNDQAAVMDHFSNEASGGVVRCTVNFCGSMVLVRQDGGRAGILWLKNSELSLQCGGNGVDNFGGNSMQISDTVIQGFVQFGVRYGSGGFQDAELNNVYEEAGCNNPQYPITTHAQAGVIAIGKKIYLTEASPIVGEFPLFANTGANVRNYYIVPKSTNFGAGPILLAGTANSSGSGTINIYWPQILGNNNAGTITYDVLLTNGTQAPYPGSANSLTTGISGSCSNGMCTYADTQGATSAYTVTQQQWYPGMYYWPGSFVLTLESNNSASFGFDGGMIGPAFATTSKSGLVSVRGTTAPSVWLDECAQLDQSSWTPIWVSCIYTSTGSPGSYATILQQRDAAGNGPGANDKGRINLSKVTAGPNHLITLVDSNAEKTLSFAGMRTTNDAADSYFGIDSSPGGSANQVGLSYGATLSHSFYIANVGDGSSWLERLTSSSKTVKVPFTVNDGSTSFNIKANYGPCTAPGDTNHVTICADPSGDLAYNKKNASIFRKVVPQDYTFAALPTANTVDTGQLAVITDASTSVCPVTTGGGSTRILVRSNGSTWDCVSGGGGSAMSVVLFSQLPVSPPNNTLAVVTDWTGTCPVTAGSGSQLHEQLVVWNAGQNRWDCVRDGLLPFQTTAQAWDGAGNGGIHFTQASTDTNSTDVTSLAVNTTGSLVRYTDPAGAMWHLGMWPSSLGLPIGSNKKCIDVDSNAHLNFTTGDCLNNPMNTLGDTMYGGSSGVVTRLAGPTGVNSVPQFFSSTPSGGVATAPSWIVLGKPTNAQTGTTYTVLATDRNGYISFSNGAAIAVTLPQAGTTGFASNFFFLSCDIGAGTATITPTTSNISFSNGSSYTSAAASMTLSTGQCAYVFSDNTNYFAIRWSGAGGGTVTNVGDCTTNCFSAGGSGTALTFRNATSGTIVLQTVTGALGSVTLSLPDATDTLVGKATSDALTNKTVNGLTITTTTGTVTVQNGKTLTASNTIDVAKTAGVAGGLVWADTTTSYSTTSAGTAKQVAISGGSATPSFIDFPMPMYVPAANCVNAVAASGWSTGATPAALCRAGTNNKQGLLSPWGASDTGSFIIHLPNDWDSAASLDISLDLTSTDATNGHTIIMQAATACYKGDGSTTDDVAYNTAQSFGTITLNGNANRTWNATLTGLTKTGCTAGSSLSIKISRTTDTATNVGVYGATVDVARLLTVQAN